MERAKGDHKVILTGLPELWLRMNQLGAVTGIPPEDADAQFEKIVKGAL